jgi:hypothetical protein
MDVNRDFRIDGVVYIADLCHSNVALSNIDLSRAIYKACEYVLNDANFGAVTLINLLDRWA